jgi:hypothetical protein
MTCRKIAIVEVNSELSKVESRAGTHNSDQFECPLPHLSPKLRKQTFTNFKQKNQSLLDLLVDPEDSSKTKQKKIIDKKLILLPANQQLETK